MKTISLEISSNGRSRTFAIWMNQDPFDQIAQFLQVEPVQSSQTTPTATLDTACDSPASQSTYFCQVKAAEAQASLDAKEFLYDPKGTKFSEVTYTPSTGEINMVFAIISAGGYLHLNKGISDSPEKKIRGESSIRCD